MIADPWLLGAVGAAVLLLSFIALLSSLETGVLNARRSRLAQHAPPERVEAVEAVLDEPERFQTSAHLAKSLSESLLYAAAALAGLDLAVAARPGPLPVSLKELLVAAWPGILAGAAVSYLAVTVLGEALPKTLAARRPEQVVVRWIGFLRVFTLGFTPILWITRRIARLLALSTRTEPGLTARAAQSEEEIKLLVESGAEEGVLEPEEKELIHSIFEFTETVARQVMVPRIDVVSVPVETPLEEVVWRAMESGHSRLPVYEGTLDTIVGILHVKDLLPFLMRGERDVPIRSLVREPYFVPEGKKIDELLQEFRRAKSQIAVVVDEFGGTAGIVTVEDVLEEIVGEIEDEYDREEHPAAELAPGGGGVIVDARMTLDDVNEQLGLRLESEDNDTLGGFVFSLFGRPPEPGESVEWGGVVFVAEAVEGPRLLKIRVITPAGAPAADEEQPVAGSRPAALE